MIYPSNIEDKIGFAEVRKLLKGRCLSTLGTEWVDSHVGFSAQHEVVTEALAQASEFIRFQAEEDDVYEEHFFDVRLPLMRIRPERTHLDEIELFDLKRSLQTVCTLTQFFTQTQGEEGDSSLSAAAATAPSAPSAPGEETEGEDADGNATEPHAWEEAKYPALARMAAQVATFPEVVRRIDATLNKYGKVKDTASSDLLHLRHQLEVTQRGISHTLRTIITEAQSEGHIERDVAPTLRDGRLVIPVAPALKRKIRGIVHDESATGKTVFIEPAAVVEANNRIRELKAAERREVIRILAELTQEIRPHVPAMLASMRYLGHIDYLRALAAFADSFECIVPEVKREPTIDLRGARHPLLEQSLRRHGRTIVPLDAHLKGEERILLISGPNAGGKSVCLKTIALLQYMLQCGLPVSVGEGTRMGLFDSLFIDIGDEQSLEDDLSTYSGHLQNMKTMMRRATDRSLLLIDEFGGGTEPQIGGALAEAILHKFVAAGTWGIITTHYQNLKHYALSCPAVVNGAMLYDRAQMQPLFILQTGNPGSSFAVEIARKIGIPEDVIAYASELVGKDYIMSDKYLQDIVRDKLYWENKRSNIRRKEKQLEDTVTRYESEMESFQKERKQVLARAKAQAEDLLKASNAKIESTIREIKEAQAEKERTRQVREELTEFKQQVSASPENEARIARKIEKIKRRQERKREGIRGGKSAPAAATSTPAAAPTQQPVRTAATLQAGDYVRLEGQPTVGRISEVNGKMARVLFGVVTMNIKVDRLVPSAPPVVDRTHQAVSFVSRATRNEMSERRLTFKPDIDLRGMRADEALQRVAYFVDEAIQFEQARVRVLHGTGTGALRELVRNYLRTCPGVKSYRDEHVQFGGAGITVIELN